MVTDEQRGRYGRWLRKERLSRGWSPEQVRERVQGLGYRVGPSSYAEWESGRKRPSKDAVPYFVELYRSEPEPEETPAGPVPTGENAALIAALEAQTAAITRLAEAIEEDRGRVPADALVFVLRQLREEGLLVRPEPSGPVSIPDEHPVGNGGR